MAKSALIAVAVALLLGGTSLAAAKTKNATGTHRSPSRPGVNEPVPGVHEEVKASPRPTAANPYYRLSDWYYDYSDPSAANPYYRLSDWYYDYSDPYRGPYDFFAVPPHIPGYSYGHTRMPVR